MTNPIDINRGKEKPAQGQAATTGTRPGMPQRDEQGKHLENEGRGTEKTGPNPGPGVTSQGHRVDEDTPEHGNDQDTGRSQPAGGRKPEGEEKPRERDADRAEEGRSHKVGDERPEHTTRAKD